MSAPRTSSGDVLGAIARLARDELDVAVEIRPEMRLVEDLELDSIRLLTLATAVEDHFRICLDEDDEGSIETVQDLIDLIERKLRETRDEDASRDPQ